MKYFKFFYDFIAYPNYGGGGYWKFNKQRFINSLIITLLFIVICVLFFILISTF